MVFKQLLLFDLFEISTSCLPAKLFNTPSGVIEGVYFLQVILCTNAHQPFYTQLQKLKGSLNENALVDAENGPTQAPTQFERHAPSAHNRLVTLHLTDGSHAVKACEYRHIAALDRAEHILPGAKLELRGPIMYRNQVLLLEADNVRLLDAGSGVEGLTNQQTLIENMERELRANASDERGTAADRERTHHFDTSANRSKKKQKMPKRELNSQQQQQQHTTTTYGGSGGFKRENHSQATLYAPPPPPPDQDEDEDADDDQLLMNCDLNLMLNAGKASSSSVVAVKTEPGWSRQQQQTATMKRPPSSTELNSYESNSYGNRQNAPSNVNKKMR